MTHTASVFDRRSCLLGEGPLWHVGRQELFWFDIVNNQLLSQRDGQPLSWTFDRNVSAAGWIDDDHLLIASETGLCRFNLRSGAEQSICDIEADNPGTRSNDGRADPWGGFWLGTMGKTGAPGQGSLYRWAQGELRRLEGGMGIPNAICFDHARNCAYYTDTKTRIVWRQPVNAKSGWTEGEKQVFVDLRATSSGPEYKPDGAVVDSEGCLWIAQWGAARVARYSPEGQFLSAVSLPTGHTSCPAFGGKDMQTLFVTTARQDLPQDRVEWHDTAGQTFEIETMTSGRPEPRVSV